MDNETARWLRHCVFLLRGECRDLFEDTPFGEIRCKICQRQLAKKDRQIHIGMERRRLKVAKGTKTTDSELTTIRKAMEQGVAF